MSVRVCVGIDCSSGKKRWVVEDEDEKKEERE